MDGVVNATDDSHVREQGPRPDAGARRADDPEPRPEPLRAVGGPADGSELGPDHHPRRQPRLGRLGHGRRDRLDTEFVVAGEPFPAIIFGYVPGPARRTGTIRPTSSRPAAPARSRASSTPSRSTSRQGRPQPARHDLGRPAGAKIDKPIDKPWIALTDLDRGDTAVWVGQGDADGTFTIPNVPAGTYTLTCWDEPQNYILDLVNVTVADGETVDMGILPLTGWWTKFDGYVFNDMNRNGKRTPASRACPNFTPDAAQARELADGPRRDRGDHRRDRLLRHRERLSDDPVAGPRGLRRPLLHDRRHLPGRQPARRRPRCSGAGVDVSVLPIIGLGGTHRLGRPRLRRDGRERRRPAATAASSAPSATTPPATSSTRSTRPPRTGSRASPGITVELYAPVACGTQRRHAVRRARRLRARPPTAPTPRASCSTPTSPRPGSGPTGCIARDVDGNPLDQPRPTSRCCRQSSGTGTGLPRRPADGRPVRHVRRPTRALPTRTSAPPSTATTASATAASHGTLDATDPSAPRAATAATSTHAAGAATTWSRSRSPTTHAGHARSTR